MRKFKFHFNTQYMDELRDAVNDRQKQSIDNVHKDKKLKKVYFAWDRTCAAMDRLQDTIAYLNSIELGNCIDLRSAFDFYDFINNAYVVIECIKTIGRIFRIDEKLIEGIETSTSAFGKGTGAKGSDSRYFEYIRSLCSVHPLCTSHQEEFLNGNIFHCCPFVTWNDGSSHLGEEKADLTAWVYPSEKGKEIIRLGLHISQFERYIENWIALIPKIIEAKNNYTDKEYERLRREPVKKLSDYSDDPVLYLKYLKEEYCRRFDYGNEDLFDDYIRVFSINLSDHRNEELLKKYRSAISYSLQFVTNELQNMNCEGYENNGIKYPERSIETTLFDSLGSINPYGGSFSQYSYNLQKLYHLEEDSYNIYDKYFARRLLEKPKELINQFVHFTNREPDEEVIVLVKLALYLEALTRKSLLNKNIPNELKYRMRLLSEEECKELFMEDESDDSDAMHTFEEFLKLIEEYRG